MKDKKKKVVKLDDLAPRHNVGGGAGKLVFGEGVRREAEKRTRAPRVTGRRPKEPQGRA